MNKKFKFSLLSLAAVGGAAQAAVPEAITTALGDMKADAVTVAVAFVIAAIAVKAIKMLRG